MRIPVSPGVSPFSFNATAEAAKEAAQAGEHLFAYDHKSRSFIADVPGASHMDKVEFFTVNNEQWKNNEVVEAGQIRANQVGAFIVGINGRRVALAPMLPAIAKIRAKVAELLTAAKSIQPWEVEILEATWSADEPRLDRLRIRTRTLVLDPATARDRWKAVAQQIPELSGTWRTSFDVATGIATFQHGDPLTRSIPYRWDEPVSYTSIPFGAGEDGETVFTGLYEYNILLGGLPKSGKSGGATSLLAGISRLEHCALVGLDPKRVELGPWRSRFTVVAKKDEHASEVLKALVEEMERRYEWLEERDLKKVPPEKFAEMPLIVILIDELADLVSIGVTKEEKAAESQREAAIRRLIAKGRAAGLVVIAATQKPSSDVISTSLRDLIQQRLAFKTTNLPMTETILGQGQAANGGLAHEIPMGQSGTAFIISEDNPTPTRVRAFWIPDEDVRGLAEQTAHLRVPLPFLPQENGASSGASARPAAPVAAPSWDDLDDLEPAPVPLPDFIP